jgi:hypothetical protein
MAEEARRDDLTVTILINGNPEQKTYPAHEKVETVIKSLLPEGDKHNWAQWQLSDRQQALNPQQTLKEAGVADGDTLSFTKIDGGGGAA